MPYVLMFYQDITMQLDIAKHVGMPYTLLAADEIFDVKDTP